MSDPTRNPVVGSMLWSAYADALGFMSELVDRNGLVSRTGRDTVSGPVAWTYRVGGRYGIEVAMPAGMYSDDTQLRLATARAIGRGGSFNVEAFTKIELPVWLSYALGGGRGTKAAASNLARDNVTWFSNFYASGDVRYFESGGNGAAMRIQPHVWATSANFSVPELMLNVTRNTVATHGHARALVGAQLHALVLADTLHNRELPPPARWLEHLARINELPAIIAKDEYLGFMWLTAWERHSGRLTSAVSKAVDECVQSINELNHFPMRDPNREYADFVRAIGGMDRATLGSGTTTAVASLALAWMFRQVPAAGVLASANTLGSDTDTIGTMAGALLGAVTEEEPPGVICDGELLVGQAKRLIDIAAGADIPDFSYPSLLTWRPPRTASDSVGHLGSGYGIAGLGQVSPADRQVYRTNEKQPAAFRWMKTTFGQTLLVKMRPEPQQLTADQLPQVHAPLPQPAAQLRLPTEDVRPRGDSTQTEGRQNDRATAGTPRNGEDAIHREINLERLTHVVIRSNFDPKIIGESFMLLCEDDRAIEKTIAFAAILAKAVTARRGR